MCTCGLSPRRGGLRRCSCPGRCLRAAARWTSCMSTPAAPYARLCLCVEAAVPGARPFAFPLGRAAHRLCRRLRFALAAPLTAVAIAWALVVGRPQIWWIPPAAPARRRPKRRRCCLRICEECCRGRVRRRGGGRWGRMTYWHDIAHSARFGSLPACPNLKSPPPTRGCCWRRCELSGAPRGLSATWRQRIRRRLRSAAREGRWQGVARLKRGRGRGGAQPGGGVPRPRPARGPSRTRTFSVSATPPTCSGASTETGSCVASEALLTQ